MRLGDLDALYQELSKEADHCLEIGTKTGISWATALQQAKLLTINAPTIDAVEVVRCKDCMLYEARSKDSGYCHYWGCVEGMELSRVEFDDFCSYGERKDGDS